MNFNEFEQKLSRIAPPSIKPVIKADTKLRDTAIVYLAHKKGYSKEAIAKVMGTNKHSVGQQIRYMSSAVNMVNELVRQQGAN